MSKAKLTFSIIGIILAGALLIALNHGAFASEPQPEIGTALTCTLERGEIVCIEQ